MIPVRCNCQRSIYQGPISQIELILPPHIHHFNKHLTGRPSIIRVDACIADTIQYLWDMGYITLGSCCGHGRRMPRILVPTCYHVSVLKDMAELLEKRTKQPWTVWQWATYDNHLFRWGVNLPQSWC